MARLRSRIAQLEHEQEELNAFVALAAHELMEPLVMIEAHAALLAADPAGAAGPPADGIGRAAGRLRRLTEAILRDVRAGEEGIARDPVDLEVVLGEVLDLLAPEIAVRSANVVATTPLPTVKGDEALLAALLTNLVINALKYGRRERAQITISAAQEGALWRVSIADDGAPIPEEERAVIFGPFKRAHHERRARGTGLGLSICSRIAERHGGTLGMLPTPTGNCFSFTLPA